MVRTRKGRRTAEDLYHSMTYDAPRAGGTTARRRTIQNVFSAGRNMSQLMTIVHGGCLILVAAFTVSPAAQTARPATAESWRVWGGPQRDFITTATGIFPP